MASESVAIDPGMYGADPVYGNFTEEAHAHLWCANALSVALQDPTRSIGELNDDIQEALRYLLSREVTRARHASTAEHAACRILRTAGPIVEEN